MSKRFVSLVVVGSEITLVQAEVPADANQPIGNLPAD